MGGELGVVQIKYLFFDLHGRLGGSALAPGVVLRGGVGFSEGGGVSRDLHPSASGNGDPEPLARTNHETVCFKTTQYVLLRVREANV